MRTSPLFAIVALSAGIVAGGTLLAPAVAQNTAAQAASAEASAQKGLTIGEVYDKLTAQGIRNIDEIEREGRSFEVKATNAQGQRVKLDVDAATGEILDTQTSERDRVSGDTERRTMRDSGLS